MVLYKTKKYEGNKEHSDYVTNAELYNIDVTHFPFSYSLRPKRNLIPCFFHTIPHNVQIFLTMPVTKPYVN